MGRERTIIVVIPLLSMSFWPHDLLPAEKAGESPRCRKCRELRSPRNSKCIAQAGWVLRREGIRREMRLVQGVSLST